MRIGLKTSIACAATVLVFAVLALLHVRPVNGPSYFVWPWRSLPWDCWLVMIAGALPLMATIAWMWRRPATSGRAVAVQLLALVVASAILKCASLLAQTSPIGLKYAADLVYSPWATSYFFDADRLSRTAGPWAAQYDQYLGSLSLHSSTKPIGPLLYFYAFIAAMGPTRTTAICSAGGLIVLASASIVAVYACVKTVVAGEWNAKGDDLSQNTSEPLDIDAHDAGRSAGLWSAALVAAAPGFILFPVKFDSLWIAIAAVMVLSWYRTIRSDRIWPWTIVLGVTLALLLFFGFHQLTLGAFMLAMPFILRTGRAAPAQLPFFLKHGGVVAGIVLGVHLVVEAMTRYSTLAVFSVNLEWQRLLLLELPARRAPYTTLWDLYDFALGFGWASAILFGAALLQRRTSGSLRWLGWAALGQLLLIALLALIPAETARCWLFLSVPPLIAIGALFARWDACVRAIAVASVLVATVVIHGTMTFNSPWPGWPGPIGTRMLPEELREMPKPRKPGMTPTKASTKTTSTTSPSAEASPP